MAFLNSTFFFFVANPAPLGLFAFGLTTALLQGGNTVITESSTRFLVYGFALFFGGLAQFLAGMWEFKRQNTFGATAFTCKSEVGCSLRCPCASSNSSAPHIFSSYFLQLMEPSGCHLLSMAFWFQHVSVPFMRLC